MRPKSGPRKTNTCSAHQIPRKAGPFPGGVHPSFAPAPGKRSRASCHLLDLGRRRRVRPAWPPVSGETYSGLQGPLLKPISGVLGWEQGPGPFPEEKHEPLKSPVALSRSFFPNSSQFPLLCLRPLTGGGSQTRLSGFRSPPFYRAARLCTHARGHV